jgi:hypothetical protein
MQRILLGFASSLAITGCIPEHDYAGSYDMTYDVVLRTDTSQREDARAGTTTVTVHHGLTTEYLVDLGASFCQLEGAYVKAELYDDWPYMDIRPQDCWLKDQPMSITGTATFDKDDNRFHIVLSGNIVDATRTSARIQFTESW